MAWMKMLWQTKLYDLTVTVKTKIRNPATPTNTLNVTVTTSIRNYTP